MCFWLHGRNNTKVFEARWINMLNMVVTRANDFNWEDILSFELQRHVGQEDSSLRKNQTPKFSMSSFLLDGICTHYAFPGMYWN